MKRRGTAQLQTRDNFGGLGFSLVLGKISPSLFVYNLHVLGFGFCKCHRESPTLQAYVLLKEVPVFGTWKKPHRLHLWQELLRQSCPFTLYINFPAGNDADHKTHLGMAKVGLPSASKQAASLCRRRCICCCSRCWHSSRGRQRGVWVRPSRAERALWTQVPLQQSTLRGAFPAQPGLVSIKWFCWAFKAVKNKRAVKIINAITKGHNYKDLPSPCSFPVQGLVGCLFWWDGSKVRTRNKWNKLLLSSRLEET